jgi:lycopene beta-cyclase
MDKYDYIIAGAGCAGLSLLHYLIQDESLSQKKILVIDKNLQKSNDRTWCFWEEGSSEFEHLITKSWASISIHKAAQNYLLPTTPFTYKMIEGLSFYESIIHKAKQHNNIDWKEATIVSIKEHTVQWEGGSAKAKYIFSSILSYNPVFKDSASIQSLNSLSKNFSKKPFLWQHFKGETIQFETEVFDIETARLMDFNVDQQMATAFMYVLPITKKKALVEYTVFSKELLNKEFYDTSIKNYISLHYPNQAYSVIHEEFGAIPMTQNSFTSSNENSIIPIGTMGGAVKASTGYAFKFIQKQTKQIAIDLANGKEPNAVLKKTRHQFYDAVLLDILYHDKMSGAEIFTRIFSKNKASTVFRFLSNTSSIFEDIKIMSTLPTRLFLFSAIRILLRWK